MLRPNRVMNDQIVTDTSLYALSPTEKADSLARVAIAVWVAMEGPMKGRIIGTTSAFDRLFEYPEGTLIGQPIGSVIPKRFQGAHEGHFEEFAKSPEDRPMGGQNAKLFGITKTGKEFRVEIALSPQFIRSRHAAIATVTVTRMLDDQ